MESNCKFVPFISMGHKPESFSEYMRTICAHVSLPLNAPIFEIFYLFLYPNLVMAIFVANIIHMECDNSI